MTRPIENTELLARYVEEKDTGCWRYTGTLNSHGYGSIKRHGKRIGAHRFFYNEMVGEIAPGLQVCHRCDNPCCVNPAHLFLGTPAENRQDAAQKGRLGGHRGEAHNRAKLTPEDVRAIRSAQGTLCGIGEKYGVHHTTVLRIRRGEYWKHVD